MKKSLTIEITRGGSVESRHSVHAVVMDGQGKICASYGNIQHPTFPRSSLKPLQAISLLESGAAEAFHLSMAEIALACASHSGEGKHTRAIAAWLQRLGLDETALECGPQAPALPLGQKATVLCNNCSGKHAGMLTLALFLKATVRGYTQPEHPVQQAILKKLTQLCGTPLTPSCCGIDGCSAPNPILPLENLACGFTCFLKPEHAAGQKIFQAMTAHPDLVAGHDRLDTVLIQAAKGKIISKGGAEGVWIAVIPERDTVLALKAEDGAPRAAQAALYGLLEKHDLATGEVLKAIQPLALPILKNWREIETGQVRTIII